MANKQEEQQIKNAILDYIRLFPRKGFAWSQYNGGIFDPRFGNYKKKNKYQRNGVPDIVGIWARRPLFIEVKTATGKVSEDQAYFIQQAIEHGAIAFVARSFQEAQRVLDSVDASSSLSNPQPLSLKPCTET